MRVSDGVRALEAGRAFVHLAGWRSTTFIGPDAIAWMNDLVTNRVDDIGPNELRRTLFLDRTGRVKADVHVETMTDVEGAPAGLHVFQDPVQPFPIEDLLGPYVLSSDVDITPEGDGTGLAVIHDGIAQVQFMAWPGPGDRIGWFPALPDEPGAGVAAARSYDTISEASIADAEVYRIRRGVPRFGVDFGSDFLPSEAGFDDLVDATKGCFLGQESVARIRNLGHPPRIIQSFSSQDDVTPMAAITAGGQDVGRITSVAPNDDGSSASIGWVRWDAREADVAAEGGFTLVRRQG